MKMDSNADETADSDEVSVPSIGVIADNLFPIFGLLGSSNCNFENKIEQYLIDALAIIFDRLELISRGECSMRCLSQGIDIKAASHPSGIRAFCSLLAMSLLLCYHKILGTVPKTNSEGDEVSDLESNTDSLTSPIDFIISRDLQNEVATLISTIFSNDRDEFKPEVESMTSILYEYLFDVMKSGRDIFLSIAQTLSNNRDTNESVDSTTVQTVTSGNKSKRARLS